MNIPAPLSQRQFDYFQRALRSWFNVAEGGKRGGKNVLQVLIFCSMLENHKNKIHLIAGVSNATAKLNILDCDGYGMLNYFEGRCREGKYKDRDCLYVKTKTGEKVVLISGGGKDGDEKLIKGNTYGMAYVTEANECHPKFLKEVFDRTLSSKGRKIFHDLNPKEPEHWYYSEILAFHEEQQAIDSTYGYNYGHFTLVDNMSLSDDKIREILKTYKKDTVWYERDIKGLRVVAEGLIFRYFAEQEENYLYDEINEPNRAFDKITMGIDFGGSGNGSQTTFALAGYIGYRHFRLLEEADCPIKTDIDAKAICDRFIEFYKYCRAKYKRIDWVFPDSASSTLINSLRSAARQNGIDPGRIRGCRKNKVEDRPRTIDMLLTTGRLKINKACPNTRNALKKLRWDEKNPNIPEDMNKGNINDRWDAFNYCFLDFIEYIDLQR